MPVYFIFDVSVHCVFRFPSRALTSTDREVANHLLETHFPRCQLISDEKQWQSQPSVTPSTKDRLIASSVIIVEKIGWEIHGFGSYKIVGENGLFLLSFSMELRH
jgi:hypothetical protein